MKFPLLSLHLPLCLAWASTPAMTALTFVVTGLLMPCGQGTSPQTYPMLEFMVLTLSTWMSGKVCAQIIISFLYRVSQVL